MGFTVRAHTTMHTQDGYFLNSLLYKVGPNHRYTSGYFGCLALGFAIGAVDPT